MIRVGKRVGSHDTSGKEGGPWDRMIQVGKRVGHGIA